MGTVSTLSASTVPTALLSQPTTVVARAVRHGLPTVGGIALTAEVNALLRTALLQSTGQPEWRLEHLRDPRPLAEMFEVSRLILDQRCVLVAA